MLTPFSGKLINQAGKAVRISGEWVSPLGTAWKGWFQSPQCTAKGHYIVELDSGGKVTVFVPMAYCQDDAVSFQGCGFSPDD